MLGGVAFLVSCAAVLPPAAVGQTSVGKACMPVSVDTQGTFTYTVRVEAGSVSCAVAREVVRDATFWPPEQDATAGWRCSVGQDPASWAINCTRGAAVVWAYGPVRERNPWVIAQTQVRGLEAPTSTPGFVLRSLRLRPCDTRTLVVAKYARTDGATLTIYEGKPYVCGDIAPGIAPRLATWRIHGQPATLRELCVPTGCARLWGDYALYWHEKGLESRFFTHGLRQTELLAIARSMATVPA
jgi:hypothetical protein